MIKRFKKGELKFYLGCKPQELADYVKMFPNIQERVELFVDKYHYDFRVKEWVKNVKNREK